MVYINLEDDQDGCNEKTILLPAQKKTKILLTILLRAKDVNHSDSSSWHSSSQHENRQMTRKILQGILRADRR